MQKVKAWQQQRNASPRTTPSLPAMPLPPHLCHLDLPCQLLQLPGRLLLSSSSLLQLCSQLAAVTLGSLNSSLGLHTAAADHATEAAAVMYMQSSSIQRSRSW